MLKWEEIATNTLRLKVVDGWLVFIRNIHGNTCCFVPDKGHKWKIQETKK